MITAEDQEEFLHAASLYSNSLERLQVAQADAKHYHDNLTYLLAKHQYVNKVGRPQAGGYRYTYAVHPLFVAAFDNNLFNEGTHTWADSAVPPWGLVTTGAISADPQ